MILRNAVLSGKHVVLDVERRVAAPDAVTADAHVAGGQLFPIESRSPGTHISVAATSAPLESAEVAASQSAALSLETVIAWLIAGDVETRTALAEFLATDIEQARSAASKEGFAAGRAQGMLEAQQKAESSLAALECLVRKAETAFAAETTVLADQCTDIVVAAFGKIVGEQLGARPAALAAVLEVLRRVRDEREVVIRVSQLDLSVIESAREQIAQALAGRKFSLVPDTRVQSGGCIVESQLGSLDGRLELQLQAWCETVRAAKAAREMQ
jgi:flagellar biosynthesis/type III secretory pathway protein FliH